MLRIGLMFVAAVGPTQTESRSATVLLPATTTEPSARVRAVVVHANGVRTAEVASALGLRAPSLRVVDHQQRWPTTTELFGYLRLRESGRRETWRLTFILSDGRAYDRRFDAQRGDVARVAATMVASLVQAIATGSVEPDAVEQPLLPTPAADKPAPSIPVNVDCPPVKSEAPTPIAAEVPWIEVGLGLHGGWVTGIGPPGEVDHLGGADGELGLRVRLRSGLGILADFRGLGRRANDSVLLRLRGALGLGYVVRRAPFELGVWGLAFAEPWMLLADGARRETTNSDGSRPNPLLGGGIRIVPGYLAQINERVRLMIGTRIEAVGGVLPSGTVARIATAPGRDPAFRVGGLELGAGVDLTVWFARWR
ncbi:MAG: hypothetical protein GY946_01965 [bacterium]|nr:hypothetical protein [bacterium]